MTISERLEIFFQRLRAAPPANTAEEAMALVCRLIEEVEDEFCPLPREMPPPSLRFTGRMYAPQKDRIWRLEGGQLVAVARRHRIYCQPNGAISIRDVHNGIVVLIKDGAKR
jgi:hypothetical protein